ncbi:MAG: hypothetical protein DRG69_01510 [Deltaproteobacteria bacterium]|nr:MAG: hypothetical protein DRG69_01510 [Deltaproteobacteria bacterium]
MKDYRQAEFVKRLGEVLRRIRELGRSGLQPQEAEDLLRLLMMHSPMGMYIAYKGKLQFVNEEFGRLTGYGRDELLGMDFLKIVFPRDRKALRLKAQQASEGGDSSVREYRILSKDGEVRWVMETITSLQREREEAILGILMDITSYKEAEKTTRTRLGQVRKALEEIIRNMAFKAEARDPCTGAHQRRVALLACAIAQEMGLSEEQIQKLRMAALVHDIGKISVPSSILRKPARLTQEEFKLVKGHPQVALDVLKATELPHAVIQIVLQHHERLDGSGYPQGLSGEEICLEARILAVADVVEAMASHRSHRPALGLQKALEEISKNSGILYDQEVVDACLRLFKKKGFKFEEDGQERNMADMKGFPPCAKDGSQSSNYKGRGRWPP